MFDPHPVKLPPVARPVLELPGAEPPPSCRWNRSRRCWHTDGCGPLRSLVDPGRQPHAAIAVERIVWRQKLPRAGLPITWRRRMLLPSAAQSFAASSRGSRTGSPWEFWVFEHVRAELRVAGLWLAGRRAAPCRRSPRFCLYSRSIALLHLPTYRPPAPGLSGGKGWR